jgi:hypothetical protein
LREREVGERAGHLELGEGADVRVCRQRRGSSESGWRRRRRGLEEVAAARLLFRCRWLLRIGESGIVGEDRSVSPSMFSRTASFEERAAASRQG